MNSLLFLPREIRDHIIEYVLLSYKRPPVDPSNDLESRRETIGRGSLRPPHRKLYSAYGLLGANSQLGSEAQSRLSQLNIPYSLDVMVVDKELWPTWTCCPSRARGQISRLDVSLRFFSKPEDPFLVHVARTFWAILHGRTWTTTSLHPLGELFLYIRDVCMHSDSKKADVLGTLCFDVSTMGHLDKTATLTPAEPLSRMGLKSMFGQHRSLWNSFRSIYQYSFTGHGEVRSLDVVVSLKIMLILLLEKSWEDECAVYKSYVGPLGAAFRSVQNVQFRVDGQDLAQLTSRVLTT